MCSYVATYLRSYMQENKHIHAHAHTHTHTHTHTCTCTHTHIATHTHLYIDIVAISKYTICDWILENGSKSHIFISVYLSLQREKYWIPNNIS